MDIRKHMRFPVQFQTVLSVANHTVGEGITLNISTGGCKIESGSRVEPGTELELHVHLPDQEPTLEIKRATVLWSREREFGVKFLSMRTEEELRLRFFLEPLQLNLPSDSK
jgi:PilZ domain